MHDYTLPMSDSVEVSKYKGGCMCGRTRFIIFDQHGLATYCHCDDCRTSTGAAVSAFVGFETTHLVWQGEPLKQYRSSPTVARGFCPECGTSLTYADEQLPNSICFYVSVFDDPDSLPMINHGYVERKLMWLKIDDNLPHNTGTAAPRD
ncbi:MAG: GFA family protein [Chloroflexota bacterium]